VESRVRSLESDVKKLEARLDELVRYLKRVEDEGIKLAARRAS
jgi:hypothetical protein